MLLGHMFGAPFGSLFLFDVLAITFMFIAWMGVKLARRARGEW